MNASYASPTPSAPSGKPFQTLEDLEAYQLAREFRIAMYAVARRLPDFDEKHLPPADIGTLKQLGWRVHNVINGYGRYLRQRKAGETAGLKESPPPYIADDTSDPFADLPF